MPGKVHDVYTFNVLLLSNRDSFDVSEQVFESLVHAQLQAVIANVGYSPSDVTVARRDLRSLFSGGVESVKSEDSAPGLGELSLGSFTLGADRLFAGADLVLIAVPDLITEGSDIAAAIRRIEAETERAGIPAVVWSATGSNEDRGAALFAPELVSSVFGSSPEAASDSAVGVFVSESAGLSSEQWQGLLAGFSEAGLPMRVLSTGSPADDMVAQKLGSSSGTVASDLLAAQPGLVAAVRACETVVTGSYPLALLATASSKTVITFGADPRFAALDEVLHSGFRHVEAVDQIASAFAQLNASGGAHGSDSTAVEVQPDVQHSYQEFFNLIAPFLKPGIESTPFDTHGQLADLDLSTSLDALQAERMAQKARLQRNALTLSV